jgi:4-hydroxy-3-polyprenylbenzoate decarboxylase
VKTVLPNADFVIEGYVDPTEPLRDEGPVGDHTGYYTLPEPYPVFHVTAIRVAHATRVFVSATPPKLLCSLECVRRVAGDGRRVARATHPATIVGIPPMENFYIGGVALTRPEATLSHPMGEGLGVRVQDALPRDRGHRVAGRRRLPQPRLSGGAYASRVSVSASRRNPSVRWDVSGETPDTAGGTPALPYKIMHGLWGMGQMMFTKYIIVVDDDVDVHNTSEVLFRLCANTDPQRDSIFTKGPADVLDHATSEIAMGTKLGIDATRKLAGEGFKRPWPPFIKMDESIRKKIDAMFRK